MEVIELKAGDVVYNAHGTPLVLACMAAEFVPAPGGAETVRTAAISHARLTKMRRLQGRYAKKRVADKKQEG